MPFPLNFLKNKACFVLCTKYNSNNYAIMFTQLAKTIFQVPKFIESSPSYNNTSKVELEIIINQFLWLLNKSFLCTISSDTGNSTKSFREVNIDWWPCSGVNATDLTRPRYIDSLKKKKKLNGKWHSKTEDKFIF